MNAPTPRPPSLFDQIGGEEPLRRLVNAFYDISETHPDGAALHRLHLTGFGIEHLRQAQFEFLCGFLGGPRYYLERMGHANLRQMHAHLAIGEEEATSWLRCMVHAIERVDLPRDVGARLMQHFMRATEALKNRPSPGG
ncbi:group II truncated hemoglobin [Methyloversatilis thermotolerans]|uniref:group II truncated hemoglobin n=1 Tax=Methyloversatilis thermotolerans TaxID=1346290 RepID=UPI0003A59DA6|nr:group II truncated hemoglobin [Methyloversatilis thermotolerans]